MSLNGFFFLLARVRKAGSRWACGTAALSAILWFRVEGPGLGSSGLGPCKSATLRDYNVNCRIAPTESDWNAVHSNVCSLQRCKTYMTIYQELNTSSLQLRGESWAKQLGEVVQHLVDGGEVLMGLSSTWLR